MHSRILSLGLFLGAMLPSVAHAVPQIVVPSSLSFGACLVSSSSDMTLTIQNTGNQVLTVSGLSITGQYDFVPPASTPFTVGPGNPVSLTVRFSPFSRGPKAGTISITSNDPVTPTKNVTLSGTGVAPVISTPSSLNFGNVLVGTTGNRNLVVTNTSTDAGQVLQVSNVTSDNPDYSITPPASTAINPNNGTATWVVTLQATSRGVKNATITVTSNDPLNPTKTVPASGIGVAPVISTSTPALNFGNIAAGSTSDLSVSIENVGDASLTVSSIAVVGSPGFLVQTIPALPASVAPGNSTSVTIRFAPGTPGPYSGTLQIGSNDLNTPTKSVALQGSALGPVISTSSEVLDFGQSEVGGPSPELPLVIGNSAAVAADLQVSAISIHGPDASSFGLLNLPTLPLVIHQNEFANSFSVLFTPGSTGLKQAELHITSNDASTPTKSIPLNGVGTGTVGVATGPFELALSGALPNPAPGRAQFDFTLPDAGAVTLTIFDAHGRSVATVASGERAAGPHSVRWEGRDGAGRPAPSGIYFARLVALRKAIVRRFVVIR